ncbi:lactate dehydrogenase [Pseudomonas caspiana]
MNSISLITANTPVVVSPATPAVLLNEDKTRPTQANSPAAVVMLGQDVKIPNSTTYNSLGALASFNPVYSLEQDVSNPLTKVLTGNIPAALTASRFQGLGAALLQQLAEDGTSKMSQSVIRSAADNVKNAAALEVAQNQLHEKADNTITLTLKTKSGATVTLNLTSSKDGLGVQADVSGGELSDSELEALGSLADSFQSAIDGLTAEKPRLNLGALAQLDPDIFTSVDLSARLKLGEDQYQTLSFKADEKNKSVEMSGPTGNVQLSVKNNNAILGNAQQQAKAVQSYLQQFDAAQERGEGDEDLMALFKDAFSSLQNTTKSLTTPTSGVSLNQVDQAMLTGLADFSASLTQTVNSPNPMRPSEVDKFSYKASQTTETKGTTAENRSVEQKQTSSLNAAYHKSLYPGVALALGTDPETQNYKYYLVEDEASSTTRIAYNKGALVEASSVQSARQSTTVQTYELAKLVDTVTTPNEITHSRNLMAMIDAALRNDRNSQLTTGKSTLEDDLKPVHDKVLLQSNPSSIAS